MSIYAIFNNLPALLVVVPLLLAPIAALIPVGRLAWILTLIMMVISAWYVRMLLSDKNMATA